LTIHFYKDSIQDLVAQGGPSPADYEWFTTLVSHIHAEYGEGDFTAKDLSSLRSAFGEALSTQTLQGLAFHKRHGYPGDYELIDKVYRNAVTRVRNLASWDRYLHEQPCARAIRNRKTYFQSLLQGLVRQKGPGRPVAVLNVASGSCREVMEFLDRTPKATVRIENVEHHGNAIRYAGALCATYHARIAFHHANAFDFRTNEKYDLIWCAGLFDSLRDRDFCTLFGRYSELLAPEGELVVGNFARNNTSRSAGFTFVLIRLSSEPLGVNLFLHARREGAFLIDCLLPMELGDGELSYQVTAPSLSRA
jgi:hypothetical protein